MCSFNSCNYQSASRTQRSPCCVQSVRRSFLSFYCFVWDINGRLMLLAGLQLCNERKTFALEFYGGMLTVRTFYPEVFDSIWWAPENSALVLIFLL